MLILSPNALESPLWLILSRGLMASFWIGYTLFVTMTMELVDQDLRGRVNGFLEMFKSISGALAPIAWGILWTKFSPNTPFILMLLLDAFVMMPILISIPETMNRETHVDEY